MRTTPTPAQEAVVVELRTSLLLPTDDLLAITREFFNPAVSCRSGPLFASTWRLPTDRPGKPGKRCAGHEENLQRLQAGLIHIDIKYLPQMPDEASRRHLFVAIDRAKRWVFMEIYSDQSDGTSIDFLSKVKSACPVKIVKLLTDNGSQLTDRYISRKKDAEGKQIPSGNHAERVNDFETPR